MTPETKLPSWENVEDFSYYEICHSEFKGESDVTDDLVIHARNWKHKGDHKVQNFCDLWGGSWQRIPYEVVDKADICIYDLTTLQGNFRLARWLGSTVSDAQVLGQKGTLAILSEELGAKRAQGWMIEEMLALARETGKGAELFNTLSDRLDARVKKEYGNGK